MAQNDDEEEAAPAGAGWILSYADLMTLLFCAFVVMYAITPRGTSNDIVKIISSIREAFVTIPDTIPGDKKPMPESESHQVLRHFRAKRLIEPMMVKFRRFNNALPVIDAELERVKSLIKMLNEEKVTPRGQLEDSKSFSVHQDPQGFKVRILASKFFKPGEYRLDRTELPKLQKVGDFLKSLNRKVVIEGHTDSIPLQGEMSNWELSTLRATSVLRYFVNTSRYPAEMISASGYADTRPIMPNDTEKGRNLNRRVEIRVLYDDIIPE
jgi:chemotaxis protein MotB